MPAASWPPGLAFWQALTRLGEAQILLPLMLAVAGWLAWRQGARRLALAWAGCTALAALLTTASKLAFIGYGIGWPAWDFTGLSGHAMFAAAVLPVLARLAVGAQGPAAAALAMGLALAGLVAGSRVAVGAHSVSEVLLGAAVGALASAATLRLAGPLPPQAGWKALAPLALAWALLGVAGAPPSRTHDAVTRLALAVSGRPQPYQRWMMHRDHRRAPPAAAPAAAPAASVQAR